MRAENESNAITLNSQSTECNSLEEEEQKTSEKTGSKLMRGQKDRSTFRQHIQNKRVSILYD